MIARQECDFIVGDSATARLLRDMDWSGSPLGAPAGWAASLRMAACLVANSSQPMFLAWGAQAACIYNDAARQVLAPRDQAQGRHGAQLWPELWAVLAPDLAAVFAGGAASRRQDQLIPVPIDGRIEDRWWTWSLSPVHDSARPPGVGGVLAIFSDVTAQHVLAQSLQAERTRLLELFKQAPGFVAVGYGENMVFHLVNDAYLQLVGFRDLIGKPVREALPEVEGQGFFELLDQAYQSGEPFRGDALPIQLQRLPDSPAELRYISFVYQPIRDASGKVIGIFVGGHDVTEQQRTQQALRDALHANQAILAYSRDVICVLDEYGRFVQVGPRAREVWGYAPEDLAGQPFLTLIPPHEQERTKQAAARILAGQPTSAFENRCLRKDGVDVPMLWSAVWVPEQRRIYAIARDISERIKTEDMLRQAQKMETIGQLTGGVAHDFNNLLTVIVGNSELLCERLAASPPLLELADMIRHAGERGAELTSRLLAFARRQALEPKILRPRDVIDGMATLVMRALGEGIRLDVMHEDDGTVVLIDPGQFESALLNLCINARDAMRAGGSLLIETSRVVLDRAYADQHAEVAPGDYLLVAVSDTGHGMTPEVLSRAIDPFFTTKGAGKGTGLGLSMVYGFIKQSGGHIKIYSEPGHGTVVKLYLPVTEGDPGYQAGAGPDVLELRGTENILLVEDDASVRAYAARLLGELGYTVLTATNGPEALDIAQRHPDIDLLFTDVIMPGGMNGPELAAAITRRLPGIPVLFTSGYTENAIVHHGRVDPGVNLLHKPYRPQRLAEKVRLALDAAKHAAVKE